MTAREWVAYWAATNCFGRDLKRNFDWMQQFVLQTGIQDPQFDDLDDLRDKLFNGILLPGAMDATSRGIEVNLVGAAIAEFQDWDIPMLKYDCHIEFDSYNAEITFTHRVNKVTLTLDDVFFSLEGKILQCVHKF